ncbi:28S ribosomal protein S7, mitochondrial isoform X1 [Schistocerca piceifrons]|uniref:28S ribosomal protein S7, mitochondrial isoform X1 n=1 Tax=Schistocerca piceifrons TaxID=274613 RepID=UPI001F5E61FD|nr:28S ribosomal protein S7, mitochondrial isoform X1 [Schistocerca piceifrons]
MLLCKVFETCAGTINVTNNSVRCCNVVKQASFSSYAPYFIDPVFKQNEQNRLIEEGEAQKLSHLPVKAALNDQTSSVFHDDIVRKFTNHVMKSGRKALARELVQKAFENIKRIQLERYNKANELEKSKIETNPQKIFHKAIANSRPVLHVAPIKRGGATYQVPVPITEKRSYFMAMKWLIEAAKDKERTVHFPEKLAWELVDAANNQGKVVRRKQELHKLCEANRAYAHYRWG